MNHLTAFAHDVSAPATLAAGPPLVLFKPATALSTADRAAWASLTARAGNRNVFAADWFMASALRHCAPRQQVRLAIVRSLDGAWLGVMPLTRESLGHRCPLPAWHSWQATNQFDASPLIEPGAEHIFWHALLGQLDRKPGAALGLCLEGLPLDDPATRALIEVCLAEDRRLHQTARFARPMLAHFGAHDAPPASPSPARRKVDKRLDGLLRKLTREIGPVRFVRETAGADPAAWIARFLALESAGWKGRAASALACDAGTAALFGEVIAEAAQRGAARLMSLKAGGEVIAMTSWLVQGPRCYGFKMAYDERFAAYAPGRLLMRAVADAAAGGPAVLFDTCARPGAAPDPLWPQSRELADYALGIGGSVRRAAFAAVMRARALRESWRG